MADERRPPGWRRTGLALVAIVACSIASFALFESPLKARAAAIAAAYLILALTEVVPPFVPTLVLLVATPLILGAVGPEYRLPAVLGWPADPVLALFAGGLSLGLAAQRHGVDAAVAGIVLRISRGSRRGLLGFTLLGTAMMSMWMSNIAAAAMMFAALRPVLKHDSVHASFRRALLLGIAVGANLGGMATPIGTGPNAIAIAAATYHHSITFLGWMAFGLPLVLGMLLLAAALLTVRYGVSGAFEPVAPTTTHFGKKSIAVVCTFGAAVAAWLLEPVHGVSAPLVALAAALVLFAVGLLRREDLGALDWSTLGLIAGGISLGKLIESSGLVAQLAQMDWSAYPRFVWLGGLVFASALLSALMSNTATAALLIPLAMAVDRSPSTAVVVAIASSFGMPFTISTPPNAMAYGEGGMTTGDFLWIGLLLMVVGCILVTLTGAPVLRFMGVP